MDNVGLAWKFCVSPASCENAQYYEDFVRLSAMGDNKTGQALTHMLIDTEARLLTGYVALRATSLISKDEAGKPIVHPCLEIAELAVDKRYERKGIGTRLVNIAFVIADTLRRKSIGIKYIGVCADPSAVGFYSKQGFDSVESLYEIPRDGWDSKCTPMYIMLPEL